MEDQIEEAKLLQQIESNEKLDNISRNTEASILVQDETKEAVKDLQTPLDVIALNTEPKEIQKVKIEIEEEDKEELASAFFSMLKGKKGDKGDKGESPTKDELISIIEPLIPEPIKGKDGEDYTLTEEDKKEIAKSIKVPVVEKVIEKTETIIEKPITIDKTKTVVKEIAKYETEEQIAEKLNKLSKAIDFKTIKNFPDFKINGGNGIGYIREASDVNINNATTGQALVWNGTAWVNGTAGTASPLTTKGDLYTYSTENARLPVGTNGQFLVADSTTATGLKWDTLSVASTLADISANSTTTADSLYTMTSGVNVDFKTSDATSLFKLNEATKTVNLGTGLAYSDSAGLTVTPTGTIVGGFTAGLNIKGADPTFRISQGTYGFGQFLSGDVGYFMQTTNNWASVTSYGGVKIGVPYWAFGSAFVPEAITHSRARTSTDIVGIFQGTTSQTANLTEWRDVSGNILSRIDSSGNVILGNNKYLRWRNNANSADVNVFIMDTNDDLQALGSWQFINGLKSDTITNRSGAMTIGTTNAVDVTLQTDSLARLTIDGSTGYVGIGDTNPDTTLHVTGGISGTIGTRVAQLEASLPELWLKDTSNNTGFSLSKYGNQVYFVNTNSSGAYSSYTGMMQLSSGSWTIGGGANPLGRLYVYGNTGASGVDLYVQSNNATSTVSVFKGFTSQSGNLTEWRNVSNTVLASISADGQLTTPQLYFNTSGAGAYITNPADGRLTLYNNSANGFDRLQFGGTTSSFPSIKRNSAGLDVRLADDSAYADITAKKVISDDVIRLKGYTVATLPTGTQGDTAFVTDADTPTFGSTVVGGGAVVIPVFFDGTNWIVG